MFCGSLRDPLGNETDLTAAELARILGGEVCSWNLFEDGTNYLANAFPRAYAVAEWLWSTRDVRDAPDAMRRMHALRCLLLGRGLMIAPAVESSVGGVNAAENDQWGFCSQEVVVHYNPMGVLLGNAN